MAKKILEGISSNEGPFLFAIMRREDVTIICFGSRDITTPFISINRWQTLLEGISLNEGSLTLAI